MNIITPLLFAACTACSRFSVSGGLDAYLMGQDQEIEDRSLIGLQPPIDKDSSRTNSHTDQQATPREIPNTELVSEW
jgi:hypothetical protein